MDRLNSESANRPLYFDKTPQTNKSDSQLRLLDQVRHTCRLKHYSIRTEKTM